MIKVRHKVSGLTYSLTPKLNMGSDAYYLSCGDGMVPSGQMIYRSKEELEEIFEFID